MLEDPLKLDQLHKLTVNNLNLWFGSKHALKSVTVGFQENAVSALVGPSGCGKSTLLRCLNRMHDLNPEVKLEGNIALKGANLYAQGLSANEVRRRIGMVFQKPNPLPSSIRENILYGLKINNIPKSERNEAVEAALHDSALWEEVKDELDKPAASLSGGQQQRLCIARAIALKPEVILMDEPCSALDPISTYRIEELILRLKQHYTIVIVTHNMQQAQRVADQTIFMYLGEVIEDKPTQELFEAPEKELTRHYIGGHFG